MATILDAQLPAQAAAGAQITVAVGEIPPDGQYFGAQTRIQRVRLISPALVTGVTTNTATISVNQYRGGALIGAQPVAQIALVAGVNLPADTAVDLPVGGPGGTAAGACQPGDVFVCLMNQAGTGLALPSGICVLVEIV